MFTDQPEVVLALMIYMKHLLFDLAKQLTFRAVVGLLSRKPIWH